MRPSAPSPLHNQKDHLLSIIDPASSGEIAIPRIYAELDDQTQARLEDMAERKGCSKRQFVLDAINHFMAYREPDTSEADQMRAELTQAITERDLARSELDKRSDEIKNIDIEISKRREDLANARSKIDELTMDQNRLRSEISPMKEEMEKLRSEIGHSRSIISLKDEEIAFMRGHIQQLSEKIVTALQSVDRAEPRKWWKFW